jgi:tripartite-type tricarboxylate transporter receptor subunit TctC
MNCGGKFKARALYLAALSACALCAPAHAAETYPARPVRAVVPFAAGGPTDVASRIVAQHLGELWRRTVVVDNRPGVGGILGAEIVIKAIPDGYTLLLGSNSTFAVNPAVFAKLPYDVFRDLRVIGLTAYSPHLLAIRSAIPANSVTELISLARKQPGKLSFASSGTGAIIHMAGELFKYYAKIDIAHIPFKGGAPATVAMLSGDVDMMMNDMTQFLAHIKTGRLKGLAVADPQRSALGPDIPTFAEAGIPEVVSGSWFGLAVPVGTPDSVVSALSAALGKVLGNAEYKERMASLGMEPLLMSTDQTAAYIRAEIEKWSKIAKAANIRLE